MFNSSLTAKISSSRTGMTLTQQKIADFILAHPLLVATMGIEELAQETNSSIATINRFVRVLGFEGFFEFRALAIGDLKHLMKPIEKMEHLARNNGLENAPQQALAAAIDNITALQHFIDDSLCDEIAREIKKAHRVFFLGFGTSSYLAALFCHMMSPFCENQILLDGQGGNENMMRLMQSVNDHDLMVSITFPRYSRTAIDVTAEFRRRHGKVIGITDVLSSPLASLSDLPLYIPAQQPVLNASYAALCAVFEAIASYCTGRYLKTKDAAKLTRDLFPYLYFEDAVGDTATQSLKTRKAQ